jgi:hypothetical protein
VHSQGDCIRLALAGQNADSRSSSGFVAAFYVSVARSGARRFTLDTSGASTEVCGEGSQRVLGVVGITTAAEAKVAIAIAVVLR